MHRTRLAVGLGAAAALVLRPRLRTWGATVDDRTRILPGDGLIDGERGIATMATTIDAPPEAIWPWLAQMGHDRAGWYSWDRLDNGGRPSADHLEPAWGHVAAGDRLIAVPGTMWFEVAHAEPGRSLVLCARLDLRGRSLRPSAPRPRRFIDSRWEFFLEPLPGGRTRVLVRSGAVGAPRAVTEVLDLLFWHPAHVIMQVRQLQNLRRRAQGTQAPAVGGAPRPARAPRADGRRSADYGSSRR
ncbi:hypothetical protein [Baekduia soli]|uniref:hypothetical protein n=1 Tax=Baekduia soli TaxID=496014 RepID=UPI0016521C01|nr:hypothetical protein [Baekduia soli]